MGQEAAASEKARPVPSGASLLFGRREVALRPARTCHVMSCHVVSCAAGSQGAAGRIVVCLSCLSQPPSGSPPPRAALGSWFMCVCWMCVHILLSFFLNRKAPSDGLFKSKDEQMTISCFTELHALALTAVAFSALWSRFFPSLLRTGHQPFRPQRATVGDRCLWICLSQ